MSTSHPEGETTHVSERVVGDHKERITITDALQLDCSYGECEHDNEVVEFDFENCPRITVEVCVDCMDERGFGRDPRLWWEELISHTDPPKPALTEHADGSE